MSDSVKQLVDCVAHVARNRAHGLSLVLPCLFYLTADIGRQDATAMLLALAKGDASHASLLSVATGTAITSGSDGIRARPITGTALAVAGAAKEILVDADGEVTGSIPLGDVEVTKWKPNRDAKGDLLVTRMAKTEAVYMPGGSISFADIFADSYEQVLEKSSLRPMAPISVRLDPQVPLPAALAALPPPIKPAENGEAAKENFEQLKEFSIGNEKELARAQYCLTEAIYFESRDEPERGQRAVAQVVLNRVKSGLYPHTICGVIYQNANRRNGCQFSYACDGFPERVHEMDAWKKAKQIADDAIHNRVFLADIGNATHYHADWVYPDWRHEMHRQKKIGSHIFYTMPNVHISRS